MKLGLNFFFVKKLVFDFPLSKEKLADKIKVGLFVQIEKNVLKMSKEQLL